MGLTVGSKLNHIQTEKETVNLNKIENNLVAMLLTNKQHIQEIVNAIWNRL